jgi:CRP/FNR family transcriptional regulator, cyclic AMP receptor protein
VRLVSTNTADAMNVFLAAVGRQKRIVVYRKNQAIFSQGDSSESMFYVLAGVVKLTIVSEHGKEAVIAVVGPGELFGESCISLRTPIRLHSAIALSTVRLMKIGSKSILQMLRAGGDPALNLISFILKRDAQIQKDLASRLMNSAKQNVARLVSSFAQLEGKGASVPKVSQQTIAEMLGITRQRVNVLMRNLILSRPSRGSKTFDPLWDNRVRRKFRKSSS